MTPAEFKAWFDGFTEAFSGCPTKAQWTRIKERVAEIDGKPVTERVYVDRYWQYYNHANPSWVYLSNTSRLGSNLALSTAGNAANEGAGLGYNSLAAMNALGRADAQSLAA